MSLRPAHAFALAVLVAGAVARPAVAQNVEAIAASRRLLLQQAEQANRSGDHARALELAQRAGGLRMTPSVRLFIAEQHQALGRLAESFGAADLCAREAERDTSPSRDRDTVLRRCRALLTDLRARLGSITIQLGPAPPAGAVVRVDGTPVAAELYGLPVVVTPGERVVDVEAPGLAPFRRTVTVGEGRDVEMPVAWSVGPVPHSLPLTSERPQPSVTAAVTVPATRAPAPDVSPSRTPSPAGPIALGVSGGAVLLLGGVFFALRSQAVTGCVVETDAVRCSEWDAYQRATAAPTYQTLLYASLGVGGALALGSVIWGAVVGTQRPVVRPSAWMAPGATGLSVEGSL